MLSLLVQCLLKYEKNSMNVISAYAGSSRILKKIGLDKWCRGKSQAVEMHVDSMPSDTACSRSTSQ